jgi:hypothetical protein
MDAVASARRSLPFQRLSGVEGVEVIALKPPHHGISVDLPAGRAPPAFTFPRLQRANAISG